MRRTLISLAAAGIVAAAMSAPAAASASQSMALSCTKHRVSNTTGYVTCTSGRYYVQLTCHLYGPPPQMTIVNGPVVNAPNRSSATCPAWYVLTSDNDIRAVAAISI
jgi:hypothetical protein